MADAATEIQNLKDAGFSDQEVNDWAIDQRKSMDAAGFTVDEVNKYFGVQTPNLNETRKYLEETIASVGFGGMPDLSGGALPQDITFAGKPAPEGEVDFFTALDRGFGASVSGLQLRKKVPEELTPEESKFANRIAYLLGQTFGDIPYMAVGAMGALPFAAATGPAAPAVVAGGAFAVPAGLRKAYIDSIQKGEITNLEDYLARTGAMAIEFSKGFAIGAASRGAGQVAAGALPVATAPVVRTTVDLGTEIATMATLGRTFEGQMPQVTDFTDAAVLLGGVKAGSKIATKLQNIYKDTGQKPMDIVMQAQSDPALRQNILAENSDIILAAEKPKEAVVVKEPVELKPAEAVAAPDLTEAQQSILGRVKQTERTFETPTKTELYTDYVDKFHPIKVFSEALGGKDIPASQDPYVLSRLTAGNIGKSDAFLEYGAYDFNTKQVVGPSLKNILEPVRSDIDAFKAYAISERALELEGRGITSGFDVAAARKVVEEGSPKYRKAFDELVQYQNNATKYLLDSGVLSKENYDLMIEANKSYVPFYRAMDEGGRPMQTKGLNVRNPVKKIKGSEREIVDPIESIVKNTYFFIDIAEKNRVMTAMVDLAQKAPEGQSFMQRVDRPIVPVEVTKSEIGKVLEQHGLDAKDAEAFTIFRRGGFQLGKDEVVVFKDGKREVYKVDPGIADAIKGMDQGEANLLVKIMAAPASLLRAGVTLSPEFMARNVLRDQMVAFLQGKGYVPVFDAMVGFKDVVGKSEPYYKWLMSGGGNAAMVALDRRYIESNVLNLAKESGIIDSTWNVATKPIELLRIASELTENSTRVGAFKRAMGKENTLDDLYRAGLESRDVTLDFSRMGAKMKAMNMITAFFNARVQGYDRLIDTLKDRPFETAAKGVATITIPSVLLWWSNSQDPRWKDIPDWQKDLFWIVMTKDTIYRIPKPFEYGLIFGSMPERMLEAYFSERPQKELEAFGKTLMQSMAVDVIPTAAKPVIEQWANKSFFTDRPIITYEMEKQLPEYQYAPSTNLLVRKVSEAFAGVANATGLEALKFSPITSPVIIDNYIRGWTGSLGPLALNLSERALVAANVLPDPVRPEDTLSDIPLVRAFVVRYPSMDAKPITEFYDRFKKFEVYSNTIRQRAREGDVAALERESSLRWFDEFSGKPQGIRDALATQARFIRNVNKNKEMTPQEKRQIMDQTYYLMIETARRGVDIMDQFKDMSNKD